MGTVASVLADHVSLRVRCIDRIGVAGYVPNLMHEGGLVAFLLHRASLVGTRNIPSPALLGHNHDRMIGDFDRFIADNELPVVRFRRGESKEQIARPYQLAAADVDCPGVVVVGKAQERMDIWRGWVDKNSPLPPTSGSGSSTTVYGKSTTRSLLSGSVPGSVLVTCEP